MDRPTHLLADHEFRTSSDHFALKKIWSWSAEKEFLQHPTKVSNIIFHSLFDISNEGQLNYMTRLMVKLKWVAEIKPGFRSSSFQVRPDHEIVSADQILVTRIFADMHSGSRFHPLLNSNSALTQVVPAFFLLHGSKSLSIQFT